MATEMLFTDSDNDGNGEWSVNADTPIGDFALRSYVDSLHATQAVQVAAAQAAADSVSGTAAAASAAASAAQTTADAAVPTSTVGANSGVAPLDSSGFLLLSDQTPGTTVTYVWNGAAGFVRPTTRTDVHVLVVCTGGVAPPLASVANTGTNGLYDLDSFDLLGA